MKELKEIDKLKKELFEAIDTICSEYENREYKKLEFKPNMWAAYLTGLYDHDPTHKCIFYITSFNGDEVMGDSFDGFGEQCMCEKEHLISVTPKEIKAHLKKICDEKYIGKSVQSIYNEIGAVLHFYRYIYDTDEVIYRSNSPLTLTVYKRGKFAEIIHDKKKLPKTKEELYKFLRDWESYSDMENDIKAYIDEYE